MLKSKGLEDNTAGALALAAATAGCLPLSGADLQPQQDVEGDLQTDQLQGVFRSWDSLCSTFVCSQDASGRVRPLSGRRAALAAARMPGALSWASATTATPAAGGAGPGLGSADVRGARGCPGLVRHPRCCG